MPSPTDGFVKNGKLAAEWISNGKYQNDAMAEELKLFDTTGMFHWCHSKVCLMFIDGTSMKVKGLKKVRDKGKHLTQYKYNNRGIEHISLLEKSQEETTKPTS